MRTIDADALREKLEHTDTDVCADYGDGFCQFGYSHSLVNLLLSETPTIDAVPVVHGRWSGEEIFPDFPTLNGYCCSNCKQHQGRRTNYCPNCGAKMDGEDNVG